MLEVILHKIRVGLSDLIDEKLGKLKPAQQHVEDLYTDHILL